MHAHFQWLNLQMVQRNQLSMYPTPKGLFHKKKIIFGKCVLNAKLKRSPLSCQLVGNFLPLMKALNNARALCGWNVATMCPAPLTVAKVRFV